MTRFRSIVAFMLMLLTVFVVNCSSVAAATISKTYTAEQIEQIQHTVSEVQALRDRMQELATLIQNRKWNDVKSFIHGPYGELRALMLRAGRELLPDADKQAKEAAKAVFGHLVRIDQAADEGNYQLAIRNYSEALKDFDAFFQLIPNA